MKSIVPGFRFYAVVLIVSMSAPVLAQGGSSAQSAMAFEITGAVKSGKLPLPGVTITAANSLTGKKYTTSTDVDGAFALQLPSRGKYVVRAELAGFAVATSEALINPTTPKQKVELEMTLLSRAPKPEEGVAGQVAQAMQALGATNGRGSQQLSLSVNAEGASANGNGGETPLPGMPALASSSDANNESFAVSGQMGNSQDFGLRNMDDLRDRLDQMRERGELQSMGPGGGPGGFGGPGGPGGGIMILGGPGGIGRGGRGSINFNKPHGTLFYTAGNAALDAAPYALSGPTDKPDYGSNRFGGMIGGPLNIPKIYNGGTKTFYFLNYTGSRSTTPYQVFSRVPTDLERAGNFSQTYYTSGPNAGKPVELFQTDGTPYASATLTAINPTAAALLNYIPHENLPGQALNYKYSNSADSDMDSLNFRLVHNFGAAGGLFGGGPMMGGGGGGRGRRVRNNINFGVNWMRSSSDVLRPFDTINGKSSTRGLNLNGGYSFGKNKFNSVLRVTYSMQKSSTSNYFANTQNVSGVDGLNIVGASSNPADWGLPGLSFTNFRGLSDIVPQYSRNRSLSINEMLFTSRGKHNVRFGGGWTHLWTDVTNNTNPNGMFTYTGLATSLAGANGTGYDFADFLLGKAQQTAIQYSPFEYNFLANSWNLFVQDDWRMRGNLTLELGLRYEYQGPYTEAHNRLVNLDVAPGFTAVAAVQPGQTGPFGGTYNSSLVNPDRNNFAPRIGFAWRALSKTVVRGGYGINYNLGQYRQVVTNLAYQPPFSFTQTNIASGGNFFGFQNGFPEVSPSTLTNNYGIDPNYRLGYVQMWNLNIQRELPKNLLLNIGYSGSKGTRLDIVRAPNRGPDGLRIPDVQSFLWESSEGSSIFHSGSVRLRKRMTSGFSVGGSYVYSKSIDNASSIGGGATVVAQNDLDLAAERGLSSFDMRHRLTGDFMYELPFGTGKHYLSKPSIARGIFGDWTWSGDFTVASGTPYTARVIGDFLDVARGTNGTLRADYTGAPISIGNPNIHQWFNTTAFTVPASGTFGNAGRNTIEGPGTVLFNMSISKNIPFKDMMGVEVRLDAQNVFNHPVYTGIDTTVNSPTFGQVISVGSMRKIQASTRFRF